MKGGFSGDCRSLAMGVLTTNLTHSVMGSGGMPPGIFLNFRPYKIVSGTI